MSDLSKIFQLSQNVLGYFGVSKHMKLCVGGLSLALPVLSDFHSKDRIRAKRLRASWVLEESQLQLNKTIQYY